MADNIGQVGRVELSTNLRGGYDDTNLTLGKIALSELFGAPSSVNNISDSGSASALVLTGNSGDTLVTNIDDSATTALSLTGNSGDTVAFAISDAATSTLTLTPVSGDTLSTSIQDAATSGIALTGASGDAISSSIADSATSAITITGNSGDTFSTSITDSATTALTLTGNSGDTVQLPAGSNDIADTATSALVLTGISGDTIQSFIDDSATTALVLSGNSGDAVQTPPADLSDSATTALTLIGYSGDVIAFPSNGVDGGVGALAYQIEQLRRIYERDKKKMADAKRQAAPVKKQKNYEAPKPTIVVAKKKGTLSVFNTTKPDIVEEPQKTNTVEVVEIVDAVKPSIMALVVINDEYLAIAELSEPEVEFGSEALVEEGHFVNVLTADADATGIINPSDEEILTVIAHLMDDTYV